MWPSIIIYKKLIGVIWPKSIEADVPLQFFRQYVRCPQQEASLMCGTDCFILFLFQQNHPCERSSLLQVLKRWAAPLFRKPPKHPDLAKAHADERHTLSLCCWTEILSWCGIWIWGLQFPCFSLFAPRRYLVPTRISSPFPGQRTLQQQLQILTLFTQVRNSFCYFLPKHCYSSISP